MEKATTAQSFELAHEIAEGKYDNSLEIVSGAIKDRMRVLGINTAPVSNDENRYAKPNSFESNNSKFHSLKINDTVVFNRSANPRYLVGAKATIIGKKQKKVVIKLHSPVGRFDNFPITCPVNIIDKV